jgi:peroxin-1
MAEKTGGLSGADLQALVYNAHLDVVHSSIASTSMNGAERKGKMEGKDKTRKYRQIAPPEGEISNAERSAMDTRVSSISTWILIKLITRWRLS